MKKYFFIAFLVAFNINALSQYVSSQKIDSLKKVLLLLSDSARIDCLNALSSEWIAAEKKDSASYYASLAYEEARNHDYIYGIAASYYYQSEIALRFYHHIKKAEKLTCESITWYDKISNKKGISDLYIQLAVIAGIQSRYDESAAYSKIAYEYAEKAGDTNKMTESLLTLGQAYLESGEYEKAFHFLQKAYQRYLEVKDQAMTSISLFTLGELYMYTGDYGSSLIYFRNGFQKQNIESPEDMKKATVDIWFKMEFAEAFAHQGQFDSAWSYFNLFKPSGQIPSHNRIYLTCTGECYYLQKNYNQALENFLAALPEHEKLNDRNQVMRTLIGISKSSLELGKKAIALKYARRGLKLATTTKAIRYKRDAYQILYLLYDKLGMKDSANFYYREYRHGNDVVLNEQIRANLAAQQYNEKIALLNNEKQLRIQELKQSTKQKKVMLFAICSLVLFGFILFRNIILKRSNEKQRLEHELEIQKLESERTKAEMQQQAAELEMQALRAQMNPHFIFNCLSSINRFILKNESESASDYLTKFSRLIRMVLTHSKQAIVSLDDELEMLRLYLEMERLRFKYSFDYNISLKNEIDPENIFIPPLLLQPFAENAIWHGLMNKEGKGHLTVLLSKEDNILSCIIKDNGVGRTKAAELKSKTVEKKKSMGIQITKERLALLNKDADEGAFFQVDDLYDNKGKATGTRVILKIRLIDKHEEHSLIS